MPQLELVLWFPSVMMMMMIWWMVTSVMKTKK